MPYDQIIKPNYHMNKQCMKFSTSYIKNILVLLEQVQTYLHILKY